MRLKVLSAVVGAFALILALPGSAIANHSWGGYHWARTQNPFTVAIGDNVSSAWDANLATASSDWGKSTVLDTTVVARGAKPRSCRPTSGRDEVCNSTYGNTGWLGVAQIWATGLHITQGTVKLNDTYFNTPTYNTAPWRQLVACQEIGHTFGLDHQDENFDNPNLGTCMDYTNDPSTNQHPNAHDYQELETIYAHLDSTTTVGSSTAGHGHSGLNSPSEWGKVIGHAANGSESLYARDLGHGEKVFTFVYWTP